MKGMDEDLRRKVHQGFEKMLEKSYGTSFLQENVTIAPTIPTGTSFWAKKLRDEEITPHEVLWAFIKYPTSMWWLACRVDGRIMKVSGLGTTPKVFDLTTSVGKEDQDQLEHLFHPSCESGVEDRTDENYIDFGGCKVCGRSMITGPDGSPRCVMCKEDSSEGFEIL